MSDFWGKLPRGKPGQESENLSLSEWTDPAALSHDFSAGQIFLGGTAGRYFGIADDRHCCITSGSRGGKGTSICVPNLLLWPGSVIATDPKGELASITARRRADPTDDFPNGMGGKVYALDPFQKVVGEAQQFRASFNPLYGLDADTDAGFEKAGMIADTLIIQSDGDGSHWTQSARAFLRAFVLYIAKSAAPDDCNLIFLRRKLVELISDKNKTALHDMIENHDGAVRQGAQELIGKPPNEYGSVLSTCAVHTEFLTDQGMESVLSGHDFDLEDLKKERISVYLCLPANRLGTHGRWFRLIVGLALDAMERTGALPRHHHPVLFCLDEFAALGHMDALEKAAGQIASFGVKLMVILQDLTQLQRHYGAAWETFLGNSGILAFWGNTDLTTMKHISERLGMVPVKTIGISTQEGRNTSTGRNNPDFNINAGPEYVMPVGSETENVSESSNTNTQEGWQLVPMLSPAEVPLIFNRKEQNILIFYDTYNPIIINRCEYYKDEHKGLFGSLFDNI